MADTLVFCRFLHLGAALGLFGAALFALLFSAQPANRITSLFRGLSMLALASGLAWLVLIAASLAGAWSEGLKPETLMLVIGQTFFGRIWLPHLLLCIVTLLVADRPRLRLVATTLLLASLAPVGHAAMFSGTQGTLLILNQFVHLLATASWLGGLIVLAIVLWRGPHAELPTILRRFSSFGYLWVGLIVLTGMINVRALSGALWPEPPVSGFGAVLAAKLSVVLVMFALALYNRLSIAMHPLPVSRLRASVTLEAALGLAAVGAVSLLGTLPPVSAP